MHANHPGERGKKPLLWIIPVVAVLLAGAFAFYILYMRGHSPQVPTPVVARGKIPPLPPSPSVDSPGEPSATADVAPSAVSDSPDDASGTRGRNDLESTPRASMEAGLHEDAPEMKSEIAAAPHEDAAAGTTPEPADDGEQTGATGASDDQASVPGSGDNAQPETAVVAEPQASVQATPNNAPSSEPVASSVSDLAATQTEPESAPAKLNVTETAAPYTIQVGAYRKKGNADRQVAQMREKGFEAYISEKNDKDQRAWYFVRFGRFGSVNAAKQALTALKEQQKLDGAIVRSKSN
jgi:cell division septation protein DedD